MNNALYAAMRFSNELIADETSNTRASFPNIVSMFSFRSDNNLHLETVLLTCSK